MTSHKETLFVKNMKENAITPFLEKKLGAKISYYPKVPDVVTRKEKMKYLMDKKAYNNLSSCFRKDKCVNGSKDKSMCEKCKGNESLKNEIMQEGNK